jgi:hypothetical protein
MEPLIGALNGKKATVRIFRTVAFFLHYGTAFTKSTKSVVANNATTRKTRIV